jgi:hypothetical protein
VSIATAQHHHLPAQAHNIVGTQARKPDDAALAFLLGLALGVMLTLSVVELWVKNAMEHGWLAISAATLAGAALYYFAQPFFPEFEVCGPLME